VQKGDTAFGIAKKHGITVRQLLEWNGLTMDAGVPLGKKLKVQP
jgi:LysM repeat protein